MRRFNKKIITLLFILITLFVGVIYYNKKYKNKEEIEEIKDLISEHVQKEKELSPDGYDLDNPNIVIDPFDKSPLTALIMFETKDLEEPKVIVHGEDKHSTIKGSTSFNKRHYVPVIGLYPGRKNKVTIELEDETKEFEIETESLPEDFIDNPVNVKANKDKLEEGELYFFTPASEGYTSAYDVNGDVRWYLKGNHTWEIEPLENGRLLLGTERSINPPYYTTGLYEMDLLGSIYNEYKLPGGYHHDYYEMENGNLIVASNEFDNKDETVEDIIVELDRKTGKVKKTWDLKDVLNKKESPSEDWVPYDWFHNNSVWYDEDEESLILSGRHQDAVISIDYDTGDLNWILGDPEGWSEEYQDYFFTPKDNKENKDFEWQWSQHSAKVTPEGYIFLLDNGNNKSKNMKDYVKAEDSYTRGVMYKIDTDNMEIEQVWQYGKERGSEFFSPYISDVDYIDENHYLIHSGGIVKKNGKPSGKPAGLEDGNVELLSTTVELLDDEEIFELTLPTNMYRAEKMNPYNNENDYEKTWPKRLGGLGKTKSTTKPGLPIGSTALGDKYNLEMKKERDRLVVNGNFEKDRDINLVLYKNFNLKKYKINVSSRPYTALCIDRFSLKETEDSMEVDIYINDEGLSGKYSIYLEVDGKLYNTDKYVNFN